MKLTHTESLYGSFTLSYSILCPCLVNTAEVSVKPKEVTLLQRSSLQGQIIHMTGPGPKVLSVTWKCMSSPTHSQTTL